MDYTWDKESNIPTLPAGSSIPYFTQNDIHGKDADGNYIPDFGSSTPWDEQGRSRFGNALYCVGSSCMQSRSPLRMSMNSEAGTVP